MAQQEQEARRRIDQLLEQAGGVVCARYTTAASAARGIAIPESPLSSNHDFPDYLFCLNGKATLRARFITCPSHQSERSNAKTT